MATGSAYAKTYNSFSGVDIKAVFANTPIAELQAISYSVTREKAPLYTMGAADPRSFSRGKRGIAGTLIFLVFDRHALLGTFGMMSTNESTQLKFMSDKDDFKPSFSGGIEAATGNASSLNALTSGTGVSPATVGNAIVESALVTNLDDDQEVAVPWFSDQIPPFDITLAAANEYGAFAVMRIYGVEILNEGYGVSIDDIVSEQQMTYVARTLVGWHRVSSDKTGQLLTGNGL
jgi:hypothetical protein